MEYTIFEIPEFETNKKYNLLVDNLIESLKTEQLKTFVSGLSLRWTCGNRTQGVLNELYKIILPHMENTIYHCPVTIIDMKLLRHIKNPPPKKEGAFCWHTDNHPPDILNIIIYLSDVGKNDGAMQYVSVDGTVLKSTFSGRPGNKSYEQIIAENVNNPHFKIKQAEGKKGTFFVFDNCIAHRASFPVDSNRDALLLQIKPK